MAAKKKKKRRGKKKQKPQAYGNLAVFLPLFVIVWWTYLQR